MKAKDQELEWRQKADWVEVYLKDMRASNTIPEDWSAAAAYYIGNAHPNKVEKIKTLSWYPTHIDKEARTIDEADAWCSAEIGGESFGVLVSMHKDTTVEFFEGGPEALSPYWDQ